MSQYLGEEDDDPRPPPTAAPLIQYFYFEDADVEPVRTHLNVLRRRLQAQKPLMTEGAFDNAWMRLGAVLSNLTLITRPAPDPTDTRERMKQIQDTRPGR